MTTVYVALALILLLSVVVGLLRIMLGPTAADRMMAAQLFGTCGVAILLLLARGFGQLIAEDVALVFALLSALSTVAFVGRAWKKEGSAQTKRHTDA
jgi:multicomponent Na+:H+ antiporter subunit F